MYNIILDSNFGSRGSGTSEFQYPSGIVINDDFIYVCDTQNNRILKYTSEFVFVSEIGASILSFPHSLTVDSTHIYVTDSANHRVVKFTISGTFVSEFGSRGSANSEFEYPGGIIIANNYLYICDTQNNRIQQFDLSFTFIKEIGAGFLDSPSSLCSDDSNIYVSDTGNHRIVVYSLGGLLINSYGSEGSDLGLYNFPNGICTIGDYLFICDTQNNRIQQVYKSNGIGISESTSGLSFPFGISINGESFISTQPHEIRLYDIVEGVIPIDYTETINKLNDQLFPTGRAWWKLKGTIFYKFMEGLALSEARVHLAIMSIQNNFFADSSLMSNDSIDSWNYVYGLKGAGTQQQRLSAILQRQSYPNNVLARQNFKYIEYQLQLAGFDVYLYNQYYNPQAAIYGRFTYGTAKYAKQADSYTLIVDNIDESLDQSFVLVGDGLRATFFVGGSTLGSRADIPLTRKNEFRELLLILKPAQAVGILYVNYI